MPLDPSFVNTRKKFTFFNLGVYLGPGENIEERKQQNIKALEFFQFHGVLPTLDTVVKCSGEMSNVKCPYNLGKEKDKSKNFLGFRYKCTNVLCTMYNKKLSPLNGTVFSNANLPLEDKGKNYFGLADLLKLMILWLFRVPVVYSQYHAEVGSCATSVSWFQTFRKICRIAESHDTGKIGSHEDVVEVDETHVYKRKHHKGRQLYSEKHLWVFGGISRLTGKRFAVRVDKRDKETLHYVMGERIEQMSFILSDGWPVYPSSPEACNFKGHASVNHSIGEFVAEENAVVADVHRSLGIRIMPETPSTSSDDSTLREIRVHTNTVERMWRDLKEHIRNVRGNNQLIEDSIGEWLYRRNILDYVNQDPGQQFLQFLKDITRVYPGLNKVGIKDPHGDEICTCSTCTNQEQEQQEQLLQPSNGE